MTQKGKVWGQLLSLDLRGCDVALLKSKKAIELFCVKLCKEIGMKRVGKPIIKRFGEGRLEGYSAVQFIVTSSITIHADEYGSRAFIDIFSCKPFNAKKATSFCKAFFKAKRLSSRNFYRF
ncbi:MAG: S-adenosylmethionine decarboxylase [Candidatus Pacearchaeota archaeon]